MIGLGRSPPNRPARKKCYFNWIKIEYPTMLKNYLTTAVRNLFKNKVFSVINVIGLALGMACCFLIVLLLQHEFSYDRFHQKADRIFRVNYHAGFGNNDVLLAQIPPPIGPRLIDYFPEIEDAARMFYFSPPPSVLNSISFTAAF